MSQGEQFWGEDWGQKFTQQKLHGQKKDSKEDLLAIYFLMENLRKGKGR